MSARPRMRSPDCKISRARLCSTSAAAAVGAFVSGAGAGGERSDGTSAVEWRWQDAAGDIGYRLDWRWPCGGRCVHRIWFEASGGDDHGGQRGCVRRARPLACFQDSFDQRRRCDAACRHAAVCCGVVGSRRGERRAEGFSPQAERCGPSDLFGAHRRARRPGAGRRDRLLVDFKTTAANDGIWSANELWPGLEWCISRRP